MTQRRRRFFLFTGLSIVIAYALLRGAAPERAPETFGSISARGVRAMNEGRYDEAQWQFDRAAELAGAAARSWERGTGLQNMGKLQLVQGRFAEAEQLFRDALEILEDHPKDPAQVALLLNDLASTRAHQGATADAVPFLQRAILLDEITDAASPQAIARLRNYATVLHAVGRPDDAAAVTEHAEELERERRSTTRPVTPPPS